MLAVEISEPGGPEVLTPVERPEPKPKPGEVVIRVAAAGVNRPDCLQRAGLYPPPDGASDLRILWEIMIPAVLPGIITAAVIAGIFAINEFLFTLLIASTKNAYTMSVALANFTGGSDGLIYNAIALVAFLAFVPIFIVVVAIQKHLSRGLTMGAVKG